MPDDLPHEYVLKIAKPYLGKCISNAVRLDAAEALHATPSTGYNNPHLDPDDPWQFKNFLITDGD